ncbi:MAG: cytochrome c553 [Pirellulaceae bacterium]|jgi:cytochrome c553
MSYDRVNWTRFHRSICFCLLMIVWQCDSFIHGQTVAVNEIATNQTVASGLATDATDAADTADTDTTKSERNSAPWSQMSALAEATIDLVNHQSPTNHQSPGDSAADGHEAENMSSDVNRMNSADAMLGEQAFNRACTTCHDAERSLAKSKSLAGWKTTVRRMAAKPDADIEDHDVDPIAEYLSEVRGIREGEPANDSLLDQTTLNATISFLSRVGNHEQPLEKPGFFVDAWLSAEWQGNNALSAKVTACTSCHSDRNGSAGFTLELVEASMKVDLNKLADCDRECGLFAAVRGDLEAGRFVVPFGAFATMSHPGISRTATNPLMFNMGRRVGGTGPLQPVLPAPFSDEGVKLHFDTLLFCDVKIGLDGYAVNGLQSGGGRIFNDSRRYYDNNREPSTGGRVTFGNSMFKFGGSLMTGQIQDDGDSPISSRLGGADFTLRLNNQLRFYFEYAIRSEDSTFVSGTEDHVYGTVYEAEMRVSEKWGLSLLARYDTLEHRHSSFGSQSTERFTVGLNTTVLDGSFLILNHEHWILDNDDYDVIALRWVSTY